MRVQMALLALLVLQRTTPGSQGVPSLAVDPTAALTVIAVEESSQAPIEGVTVTIALAAPAPWPRVIRAVTLFDGQLSVAGIAPGPYRVVATPPDAFAGADRWSPVTTAQSQTVALGPGQHPVIHFAFKRAPVVSGLVQTADGKAAAGVPVELVESLSTVHDRPVLAPVRRAASDGAGRFVFDKLRPGQYYVRARPPAPPGAPFNFVYAPGTTTLRDITPLAIEAGDEVNLGLTLHSVPTVRVSGRVVDANGDRAANVRISLTALDRATTPLSVPGNGPGSELAYAATTDPAGAFAVSAVFQGLYALRAVARRDDKAPILAAGVAEVEVATADIADLVVALAAPARLTGRFMFNGAEEPDPARTQIAMAADGPHNHLLGGLSRSGSWHADGRFEIEGIFGAQRLTVGSTGNWFIERATLEDGTEASSAPYPFVAGRTYSNVRVWLSDRVATLGGPLPAWWDPHAGIAIIAFPESAWLRKPDSRLVRLATVSMETKRFSISGLPPGQSYLVAAFSITGSIAGSPDWRTEELFELLTPMASRVMATDPQLYEVVLGPPLRR